MNARLLCCWAVAVLASAGATAAPPNVPAIDEVLNRENAARGVALEAIPVIDDLAYLRRVSVDLIGRIPTEAEIQEYLAWSPQSRREQVVEKLLRHERFNNRWTVFYSDMLRLRSNAEGGQALIAYVHQAVSEDMPYDELARRLISAGGKAGMVPEVGFVLGDNADPMALAGVTSQVFMGIRISCAQCHDHPFDKWTQKDFYGLAAYFGKTRRQERRLQDRILGVYTTEVEQSAVLWPPEGLADDEERQPMQPVFPIEFVKTDGPYQPLARLEALRNADSKKKTETVAVRDEPSLDDLLAGAAEKANARTNGGSFDALGVTQEAKQAVRQIDLKAAAYNNSELRARLAELVTDPRNAYFSRCFVNRVWAELVGHGFVEPVDDLGDNNPATHPKTLAFLADEFVAQGYDLRTLVRQIVLSDAYSRGHAFDRDETERQQLEAAFLATPLRRMLSETLYDSLIAAGHLFAPKHKSGQNLKVVWQEGRYAKKPTSQDANVDLSVVEAKPQAAAMKSMTGTPEGQQVATGYNLEKAIELDFDAILQESKEEEGVKVEQMMVKSAEELEAERLAAEMRRQQAEYVDTFTKAIVDDNPQYGTAMRMPSPAPEGHFLRVFGQPNRADLGEGRDSSATMRQALMILNGKLTNEAARVGELEPIYALIAGKTANLEKAVRLAYREILTREPTAEELATAHQVIDAAETPRQGLADLRWVLLNCHEFRFLP